MQIYKFTSSHAGGRCWQCSELVCVGRALTLLSALPTVETELLEARQAGSYSA